MKLWILGALLVPFLGHSQVSVRQFTDTARFDGYFVVSQRFEIWSRADSFYNKELTTQVKAYYNSGVLKEEYNLKGDFFVGEYRDYYANGQLCTFYTNSYGNKDDVYLEFYEDGSKKVCGSYRIFPESPRFQIRRDTSITEDSVTGEIITKIVTGVATKDIKDGIWYYWGKDGQLIRRELWRRGIQVD